MIDEKILVEWKKKYSLEELKSIIGFMKDPINKVIAQKLLLDEDQPIY